MQNSLINISMLIFILLVIISCDEKKDNKYFQDESIEVFYNSNKQAYLEKIEIKVNSSKIYITINYSNKKNIYIGEKIDNKIIVERGNGNELHLYKNGAFELRVYKVVGDGYQPEDIEWTFYKNAGSSHPQ